MSPYVDPQRYSVRCFEPANVCLNGWSTIYITPDYFEAPASLDTFYFIINFCLFSCMRRYQSAWDLSQSFSPVQFLDTSICSVRPLSLISNVKYYKIIIAITANQSSNLSSKTWQTWNYNSRVRPWCYGHGLMGSGVLSMMLWSWAHRLWVGFWGST